MKLINLLLILFIFKIVSANDFLIYNVGYNKNNDIIISITNTGNSTLKDFDVYIDDVLEKKINAQLEPESAFQFYIKNDGVKHKLKICSETICKETEIIGFYEKTYVKGQNENKKIDYMKIALVLIILIILGIIILLLVNKKTFKNFSI
ncbi:MAG: hypothetical protein KQA41_00695 [Candidatus Aenigmarchaeota archaeon]|nr:hypothetical protein [Candidatus Aenigmarchaeota archaeon]